MLRFGVELFDDAALRVLETLAPLVERLRRVVELLLLLLLFCAYTGNPLITAENAATDTATNRTTCEWLLKNIMSATSDLYNVVLHAWGKTIESA